MLCDHIGGACRPRGALEDAVRTRMILTRIDGFATVARVRKEWVGDAKLVDTIMQVSRFVNPDWLIEVEADAVIADPGAWRI